MWIVIQARSNSARFPNKWTEMIGDKILLQHTVDACRQVGRTIVACPYEDNISLWCRDNMVPCFEGPETDVLKRYFLCAKTYRMKYIIRVTADCPFLVPPVMTYLANHARTRSLDYFTNLPCVDGHDTEVMSFACLEWANKTATLPEDREHVTTYIRKNIYDFPKIGFRAGRYKAPYPISIFPKISVDTPEDLKIVRKFYEDLSAEG